MNITPINLPDFPSRCNLHCYYFNHYLIKIKIIDLFTIPSLTIERWEYNRPPDAIRCIEIAKYIYTSRQSFDTIIYTNFNTKKNTLEIVDGIHRYTALKIIYDENHKQPDLLTSEPNYFGENGNAHWLYETYILLSVRIDATEGQLRDLFISINKSIPVPQLYIYDYNAEKVKIIEKIVLEYREKYKSHFSPNLRYNSPNINSEDFKNILDNIYEKYGLTDKKIVLSELVDDTNIYISKNMTEHLKKKNKISEKILEKCQKSGCWLFIYKNDVLLKMFDYCFNEKLISI